ncbi:hypothetical protein [Chrysiogenes arsenatis]|uniref:hypothetical protein n=1 Tax=Chrysiogenes arsenatis TaxID=309797 RepID=UPI0003FF2160|nr:hypothetical protein [Chrysiogenes arsenatis]
MNVDALGGGYVKRSPVKLPEDSRGAARESGKSDAAEKSKQLRDEVTIENRLSGMSSIRDVEIAKTLLKDTIRDMVGNSQKALDAYKDANGSSLGKLL